MPFPGLAANAHPPTRAANSLSNYGESRNEFHRMPLWQGPSRVRGECGTVWSLLDWNGISLTRSPQHFSTWLNLIKLLTVGVVDWCARYCRTSLAQQVQRVAGIQTLQVLEHQVASKAITTPAANQRTITPQSVKVRADSSGLHELSGNGTLGRVAQREMQVSILFRVVTAWGGGGSFKNRKSIGSIGEIGCCESWMTSQKTLTNCPTV